MQCSGGECHPQAIRILVIRCPVVTDENVIMTSRLVAGINSLVGACTAIISQSDNGVTIIAPVKRNLTKEWLEIRQLDNQLPTSDQIELVPIGTIFREE